MPFFHPRRLAVLLLVAAAYVYAEKHVASIASMSVPEIEEQLQVPHFTDNYRHISNNSFQECALVQDLNNYKLATSPQTSSLTSRIFAVLFPGSPGVNALLATLYISGPPNFLLALCPPNIDPSSLSIMVAFAVGGLLGDTLFHLLPEIFLGEDSPEHVRFVLVEPNRNLLLGVAIMVGFVTFVAMDKGLRIATGGEGGHDHSHGHAHETETVKLEKPTAVASAVHTPSQGAKSRKKENGSASAVVVEKEKDINASVKLAGYLNLV